MKLPFQGTFVSMYCLNRNVIQYKCNEAFKSVNDSNK